MDFERCNSRAIVWVVKDIGCVGYWILDMAAI